MSPGPGPGTATARLPGEGEEAVPVIEGCAADEEVGQRVAGTEGHSAVLPARPGAPGEVDAGLSLAYATEAATAPPAVDAAFVRSLLVHATPLCPP